MKNLIAIITVTLILTSCASLSKSECERGEWQSKGFDDAISGRASTRFSAHTKACAKHGITVDNTTYMTGYQIGLKRYCRAETGISKGRDAEQYNDICPAELESGFLSGYLEGLDIALRGLNNSYTQTQNNIFNARFQRQRLESADDIQRIDEYIIEQQNRLRTINNKQNELQATIARWSRRV